MKRKITNDARSVKRIVEAIGYVELGLWRQAEASLGRIGELGVYQPVVKELRKEISRRMKRRGDDVIPLELAAPMAPEFVDKSLWLLLGACCHQAGELERVAEALRYARDERRREKAS